jgi:ABC-2 type transport system ATP-binding protein
LLFDGDVESAIRQVRQRTVLKVTVANGLNNMAKEQIEGHAEVASVEHKTDEDVLVVTLNDHSQDGSFIAELLVKNGFRLKMLKEEEIDLEDVFMGITKGITN